MALSGKYDRNIEGKAKVFTSRSFQFLKEYHDIWC
jgi:hypothetical protein